MLHKYNIPYTYYTLYIFFKGTYHDIFLLWSQTEIRFLGGHNTKIKFLDDIQIFNNFCVFMHGRTWYFLNINLVFLTPNFVIGIDYILVGTYVPSNFSLKTFVQNPKFDWAIHLKIENNDYDFKIWNSCNTWSILGLG